MYSICNFVSFFIFVVFYVLSHLNGQVNRCFCPLHACVNLMMYSDHLEEACPAGDVF